MRLALEFMKDLLSFQRHWYGMQNDFQLVSSGFGKDLIDFQVMSPGFGKELIEFQLISKRFGKKFN